MTNSFISKYIKELKSTTDKTIVRLALECVIEDMDYYKSAYHPYYEIVNLLKKDLFETIQNLKNENKN